MAPNDILEGGDGVTPSVVPVTIISWVVRVPDLLDGGDGNGILSGGAGEDQLTGLGSDVFKWADRRYQRFSQ